MTTCSLDGVELATIGGVEVLRVVRPFAAPRHRVVDVPGRAGSAIFTEEPGDRILELELHLLADSVSARRSAVAELARWAYVGAQSRLIIDDQPDRFEEAILEGAVSPAEWLNAARLVLPFRCGPYSLALSTTTNTLTAATNPDSGSFSVSDDVDARPVVEIIPAGGGIDSFTLTVNDFAISWSFGIEIVSAVTVNSLGEVVTIGLSSDVELTGVYDPDKVAMADVSGSFPILVPGSNSWSFEWTGSATSVALDVTRRERFMA